MDVTASVEGGDPVTVEVKRTDTVAGVKRKISEALGVVKYCRYEMNGEAFDAPDDEPVSRVGISPGAAFHVAVSDALVAKDALARSGTACTDGSLVSAIEKGDARTADLLFTAGCTLSSLSDLTVRNLAPRGASLLARVLRVNTSIKDLEISGGDLTEEGDGMGDLAEALGANTTLERLALRHIQVSAAGTASLASALKHNSTLRCFFLDNVNLGSEGAIAIANAFSEHKSLRELFLMRIDPGCAGTVAIIDALKANTALQWFGYLNNSMGDENAERLASVLAGNRTLRRVDIWGNEIHDKSAAALASALAANTTLEELDVASNPMTPTGGTILLDALKANTTLTELRLPEKCFGDLAQLDAVPRVWKGRVTTDRPIPRHE